LIEFHHEATEVETEILYPMNDSQEEERYELDDKNEEF
jgi:hypothetical protein